MACKAVLVLAVVACLVAAAQGQQMTLELPQNFTVGWNASQVFRQQVPYNDSGAPLLGFLAYDNTTNVTRPAVVIIPDWDGIGPYEMWRAELLATLGYVGFVADIYGANVTQGPSLPTANRSALTTSFISNPTRFRQREIAALDVVRAHPLVNASKIAVIGYCFGGTGVIELGRAWPNGTDGLRGVVSFHGGMLNTTGTKALPGNPIRFAVLNGAKDPTVMGYSAFRVEMDAANVTWEVTDYSNTLHAFTEPTGLPSASSAYNAVADRRSWSSLRTFLDDIFRVQTPANYYTYPITAPATAARNISTAPMVAV